MGLFSTIRGVKHNVLFAAGASGLYVMTVAFLDFNALPGIETTGVAFLTVLLLYGLWTGNPKTALIVMGAIAWVWTLGAVASPTLAPELHGRPITDLYGLTLAPVLAVGAGVFVRSLLFHKPRRSGRPTA